MCAVGSTRRFQRERQHHSIASASPSCKPQKRELSQPTGFVKSFPKKIGPLANNPLGFPHNQTNGQKQFPCCCCVLCSFDRLKLLRHLFKVQKSDSTLRKELKKHRSQKFSFLFPTFKAAIPPHKIRIANRNTNEAQAGSMLKAGREVVNGAGGC
jgi:hypothetical protein